MSRKRFISSHFYCRHGAATLSSRRWLEDRRHSDRFVNYYKIQKQKVTTIYFYLPFGTLLGFLSQDIFLSTISNSKARGDNGFLKGLTLDSQLGVQAAQADPNCSLFKVWLACQKQHIDSPGLFPPLWHAPELLSQLEAYLCRGVKAGWLKPTNYKK